MAGTSRRTPTYYIITYGSCYRNNDTFRCCAIDSRWSLSVLMIKCKELSGLNRISFISVMCWFTMTYKFGLFCVAKRSVLECGTVRFMSRNGPFRNAKWHQSQCCNENSYHSLGCCGMPRSPFTPALSAVTIVFNLYLPTASALVIVFRPRFFRHDQPLP